MLGFVSLVLRVQGLVVLGGWGSASLNSEGSLLRAQSWVTALSSVIEPLGLGCQTVLEPLLWK